MASAIGNRAMTRLVSRAREPDRAVLFRCSCGSRAPHGGNCQECEPEERDTHRRVLQPAVAGQGSDVAVRPTRRLARIVGTARCTAGVAGASDDPVGDLTDADSQAQDMATQLGALFADEAKAMETDGIPDSPSTARCESYFDRFGIPPAQGTGFLNRLTGTVARTQQAAVAAELRIVSRRFTLIAKLLKESLRYTCSDGFFDIGNGCKGDLCGGGSFAFSCRDNAALALCPPFWTSLDDNTARGAAIIHELTHVIWGPSNPSQPGEIGEAVLKGPGRNFDIAGCWEGIVDDVFDTDSKVVCPAVP